MAQHRDRLRGLAQPHLIGQYRAAALLDPLEQPARTDPLIRAKLRPRLAGLAAPGQSATHRAHSGLGRPARRPVASYPGVTGHRQHGHVDVCVL